MPRGLHPNSRKALEASRPVYPPAPEGNKRREVHGGYSAPGPFAALLSEQFFDALSEGSPLTDDPRYIALVAVVSLDLERLASVRACVDKNIADLAAPRMQPVLDREERLRRSAINGLERLRMAPASREDELELLIGELRAELVQIQASGPSVRIEYVEAEASDGPA